jgi:hypothetical protein
MRQSRTACFVQEGGVKNFADNRIQLGRLQNKQARQISIQMNDYIFNGASALYVFGR